MLHLSHHLTLGPSGRGRASGAVSWLSSVELNALGRIFDALPVFLAFGPFLCFALLLLTLPFAVLLIGFGDCQLKGVTMITFHFLDSRPI